jgi:hypothetical protein
MLANVFDHHYQLSPTLASFWPSSLAFASNCVVISNTHKNGKEAEKYQIQASNIFYFECREDVRLYLIILHYEI